MIIANPIYDVVFKYFLEDNKLAKLFIGALLEVTILELEFKPQEVSVMLPKEEDPDAIISVVRLDFKARISDGEGNTQIVLIELQKSKVHADLFRFRNYLGAQYQNKDNSIGDEEFKTPLPIIGIYFLGYRLDIHQNIPVIQVKRSYIDNYSKEVLQGKEQFIEMLTHNAVIVQMPALKERRRYEIEKILSIFDIHEGKFIEVDENEYPQQFVEILIRLNKAVMDPNIVRDMDYEEDLKKEFKGFRKEIEEERRQKEEALLRESEANKTIRKSILLLLNSGMEIEKIANQLEKTTEEIKLIMAELK